MSTQTPVQKLHKFQACMILDYLGFPLKDLPRSTKEIRSILEVLKQKHTEKYDAAYSIIVDKNAEAKGKGEEAKSILLDDAARLISDEVSIIKDSAIADIASKVDKASTTAIKEMASAFSEACEIESKKYNTVKHVVQIGDAPEKELKGVVTEKFSTLAALATMRKNILMVGPAGCGKTFVAGQIAESLKLPFASQSCSAGVSETAFTGKLLPIGDNGKFEYIESDFVNIYENGGVFLFDEIDASDANVLVFMNQALANEGFYNPSRVGNTYIKKHKDFIAVAAANTFGTGADAMYSARNTLDAATLDRFRIGTVELDYSPAIEKQLVDPEILKFGLAIRNKINSKKLQKICSTRFLRDATDMKQQAKWTMDQIADMYFADWSKEELAVIGVFNNEQKSQIAVAA